MTGDTLATFATTPVKTGEIDAIVRHLLRKLHHYWKRREEYTPDGSIAFHYSDPHRPFSARFLSDLMLGYLAVASAEGDRSAAHTARLLGKATLQLQQPDGSFRWNLPDPNTTHPDGVRDQVDLGMVLDAFAIAADHRLLSPDLSIPFRQLCKRATGYLATVEWPDHPGVVRKRDYDNGFAPRIDILNAAALAAKAWSVSAKWNHAPLQFGIASRFLSHLQRRFGHHYAGWWPYSETLDDHAVTPSSRHGRSVFFQAMMVVHLAEIGRHPQGSAFLPMIREAAGTVASCVTPAGEIDSAHESRNECIGKPNALVADALLRLGDAASVAKAGERLRRIASRLTTPEGDVVDETGAPVSDIWKVWLFSDLARLYFARTNGAHAAPFPR